jgi:hypothetical protein
MREYGNSPEDRDAGQPGREQAPERVAEYPFRVHGAEFTARLAINADTSLEWSEFADAAMQTEDDIESPAGAAFLSRFFKLVLGSGEYRRFRAVLRQHKSGTDLLVEIMEDVQAFIESEFAGEADRPTVPSSSSPGGRTAKDERRLQIISLAAAAGSDGEIDIVPSKQQARKQARQKRRPA